MSWVVYAISKDIQIIETPDGSVLMVDPEEDKLLYIGYTDNFSRRMKQHFNCAHDESYEWSQKFYNRIRNKWDDFDKTILVRGIRPEQEAKDLEIELIEKYNSHKKGMNSTPGGDGVAPGADHPNARAIRAYNNSTKEETLYTYFGECVAELGISESRISMVLSTYTPQAKSKDGIWYQFKYSEDTTPFIENMPTKSEKKSDAQKGGTNPNAKSVCVFGKLYDCATTASTILFDSYKTTDKKFISKWIGRNKFPDDVFKVSKEFYEHYKDSDEYITRNHIFSFENS